MDLDIEAGLKSRIVVTVVVVMKGPVPLIIDPPDPESIPSYFKQKTRIEHNNAIIWIIYKLFGIDLPELLHWNAVRLTEREERRKLKLTNSFLY